MESVQLPDEEPAPLTTKALVERRLITFVIERTNSFEEAATYLGMSVGTMALRCRDYDIHTPPRGTYTGPRLTHEEMEAAFIASLAATAPVASPAELLQALLHEANVTITMPGGTAKTFPFSQLIPLTPNPSSPPWRGGARLG